MIVEYELIREMFRLQNEYLKLLQNKDSILYLEKKRNAVRHTIENIEFI